MTDNSRPPAKDMDITGPNQQEKIIRPDPQSGGQRLSKRARQYGLSGLIIIGALIVLGVALSGRHGITGEEGNFSNPDLIGQAAPPAPPPVLAAESSQALGDAHGGRYGHRDPLASATRIGMPSGDGALTPGQKYHEWLQDQHYKDLQGQVLAAQAAQLAPPGKAAEHSNNSAVSGNTGTPNTADYLRASLDVAKAAVIPTAVDQNPQSDNKKFLEEQRKELDKNGYLKLPLFTGHIIVL